MAFLAYFGHLNIDVRILVENLPKEGSVNAKNVEEKYGGTAGNFAIVSKKLGLDFDIYSAVGSKTHSGYLSFLKDSGIGIDHIKVTDEYGPICYIASDTKKQVAYMYQGPMLNWSPRLESHYEYIHLSTGPKYTGLIENKESKLVFDPSQEIWKFSGEELKRFYEASYISFFNGNEMKVFREATGLKSFDRIVIETVGPRGSILYKDSTKKVFPALPSSGDTIGAGDAFRAGFYYALFRKKSIETAMVYGTIAAHHMIEDGIDGFSLDANSIEQESQVYKKTFGIQSTSL
ncbi:2-dehydro-3-deoxyglucokinase [Thermoplasma volcanium GSS1]|uniref:2-dehydro-3-deoxyglucokinase n=1 Tax=Thermoplasma volcanium (strain ATCC 51530 / DSM 4299 / JCM 9571 / NBRC 15438 / GSS1) TaxID=273116 RepID=Q97A01_THEVO|nr:carbohydrate kinase family protein [Thermoplasma volcanium]BAB60151.1 2-dehydro-3-deoxyglucokinase [Thermoplasma volcanium GSS1]